jgi:hypothetical protein
MNGCHVRHHRNHCVMELVRDRGPTWSNMVQHGPTRSKGEEKAQRASDTEKKLACMPAGVVSPGTQLCANNKGSPREEMG